MHKVLSGKTQQADVSARTEENLPTSEYPSFELLFMEPERLEPPSDEAFEDDELFDVIIYESYDLG